MVPEVCDMIDLTSSIGPWTFVVFAKVSVAKETGLDRSFGHKRFMLFRIIRSHAITDIAMLTKIHQR